MCLPWVTWLAGQKPQLPADPQPGPRPAPHMDGHSRKQTPSDSEGLVHSRSSGNTGQRPKGCVALTVRDTEAPFHVSELRLAGDRGGRDRRPEEERRCWQSE